MKIRICRPSTMTRHRGLKDNVAKLRRLTNLLQCGLSDVCCWCLGGDAIDFPSLLRSRLLQACNNKFKLFCLFYFNFQHHDRNPNPYVQKRGILIDLYYCAISR
jgi:hypothetical protein